MTVGSYTSYLGYLVDGSMARAIKVTYNISYMKINVMLKKNFTTWCAISSQKKLHHLMCDCEQRTWRCSTAQNLQELLFQKSTEAKTWRIWKPFEFPVWHNDKNLNKLFIGEGINKLKKLTFA